MHAGDFQRFVWVKGDRRRQRNREKYEETRKRYLESEVEDVEPPKKQKVVWPGEFENQLKKRNRNLEKIEEREGNGVETPALHTPSDTQSLISNDSHSNLDLETEEPTPEKVEDVDKKKSSPRKTKSPPSLTPISINDTHFMDEYLDEPKKLNLTSSGGSFFLVSSNLVNE